MLPPGPPIGPAPEGEPGPVAELGPATTSPTTAQSTPMSDPGSIPELGPAADLDLLLARADAYRLAAAALRDPDGPTAGELELEALLGALGALGLEVSVEQRATLARIVDRAARAAEHRRLFGHTVAHGCPPYETEFGRSHVFAQVQELADITAFYAAFGLRPTPHQERPDHLAVELEFVGLLTLKTALAQARGEAERARIALEATARFLTDHLGRWLPALVGLTARRSVAPGIAALLGLVEALVTEHARALGVVPDRLGPDDLRPILGEPDGFVFPCGPAEADPTPPA